MCDGVECVLHLVVSAAVSVVREGVEAGKAAEEKKRKDVDGRGREWGKRLKCLSASF